MTARDQGQLKDDRTGIDGTPAREEDWTHNRVNERSGATWTGANATCPKGATGGEHQIVTYAGSGIPAVFDKAGNMTVSGAPAASSAGGLHR